MSRFAKLFSVFWIVIAASLPLKCSQGGEVTLSLSAAGGEWKVWAAVTELTSTTSVLGSPIAGIAGFAIDVTGAGGLDVLYSRNESPFTETGMGFTGARTDHAPGEPGMLIGAFQLTFVGLPAFVIDGVGLEAGSAGDVEWGFPVLLASGTYMGGQGYLRVEGVADGVGGTGFSLLYGQNGIWTGREDSPIGGADVEPATEVHFDQITIMEMVGGDYDLDNDVDGNDFLIWQAGFGLQSGAKVSDGDADNDGDVDGNDFLAWQANFGFNSGWDTAVPASTAVPEPSAAALLLLAFGLMLRRRTRTR